MTTSDASEEPLRAPDQEGGSATSRLLPLVYDELRAAARRLVGPEDKVQMMRPTALVHDAYMRLAGHGGRWESRRHFLCVAAKAMRQILSDRARELRAEKRGGNLRRITLHDETPDVEEPAFDAVDLLALDDALRELSAADERAATVVEMRYLAGMTVEECASTLNVSPTTVKEDWRAARAWLQRRLASKG